MERAGKLGHRGQGTGGSRLVLSQDHWRMGPWWASRGEKALSPSQGTIDLAPAGAVAHRILLAVLETVCCPKLTAPVVSHLCETGADTGWQCYKH